MIYFTNFIIFITGPTCSGKTKLSLDLFDYFPVEIINIDASIIYKYMDIGTGKPSLLIRSKFKHHLIDIKDPCEQYCVWDFCIDAFVVILDCFSRGKIPLFVGGTMMYMWYLQNFFKFFKNLLFDYQIDCFNKFRDVLTKFYKNDKFFNTFCKVYKDRFFLFNYFNFDLFNFTYINIFLVPFDKDFFYCKIKNRLLNMLNSGFLDEVEYLRSRRDLTINTQSIKSIGYKDLWLYLDNKLCFFDAVNSILKSTINLSNKQLKWAKKFGDKIFYIENKDNFLVKECVKFINMYLL